MQLLDKNNVLLMARTAQVLPDQSLKKKLAQNRPLIVKLGMDPTTPDLHLGHAVVLKKLRDFQDCGHQAVLVIGDFTALIGDPTGKSKTRPPLSIEEIIANQKTYVEQAGRILDLSRLKIVYNSQWLKPLSFSDIVQLCGKITVARIIERDDFRQRLQAQTAIGLHELLYPLMQAYDSVMLKADVELGGTDQTFNLMVGRFLQDSYAQEPQVVMTMPILEGLDGVAKMSKSLGNTIVLDQEAENAFGQLMSISDDLMWRYAHLLTSYTPVAIEGMQEQVKAGRVHPFTIKKEIAQNIVSQFWSVEGARQALITFESLFQKGDLSKALEKHLTYSPSQSVWIVDLLKDLAIIKTSSEAKRLIESGAVSVDGEKIIDFSCQLSVASGMIIKAGKHAIFKIILS